MKIKITAINYRSIAANILNRKDFSEIVESSKENVKEHIDFLLFDKMYSYLLIKIDEKLFICEPLNKETRQYSRREITYHPLNK